MPQEKIWESEYRSSKLVTKGDKPQSDVMDFFRWLRKEQGIDIRAGGLRVLDLGCGTGRNSNYLAELGNHAIGYEISSTALQLAEERAKEAGIGTGGVTGSAKYFKKSIGAPFALDASSVDLALDVTSSNSLNELERAIYLSELSRVLKPGAWLFLKALCKDGDQNAKNLMKKFPGPEKDTYVMPDLGLVERVWSREDLAEFYGGVNGAQSPFEIVTLGKKTNYSQIAGRSYKRNFWIAAMRKKAA